MPQEPGPWVTQNASCTSVRTVSIPLRRTQIWQHIYVFIQGKNLLVVHIALEDLHRKEICSHTCTHTQERSHLLALIAHIAQHKRAIWRVICLLIILLRKNRYWYKYVRKYLFNIYIFFLTKLFCLVLLYYICINLLLDWK